VTADAERELSGGTVIWLFVAIELLTFGMFFVGFAAGISTGIERLLERAYRRVVR
jgi:hypothetical protein